MKQYNAYFRLVTDTSPSNILFKLILFRFSGAVQDVNSVCDGFVPCEKLCSDSGCWHKQEVGAGLSQLNSLVHQNQPVCEKTELCQFFWVQEKIWQKILICWRKTFLSDTNCCPMRKTRIRHCSEIILASGLQVHLLGNSTSSCRSGFWRRGATHSTSFIAFQSLASDRWGLPGRGRVGCRVCRGKTGWAHFSTLPGQDGARGEDTQVRAQLWGTTKKNQWMAIWALR